MAQEVEIVVPYPSDNNPIQRLRLGNLPCSNIVICFSPPEAATPATPDPQPKLQDILTDAIKPRVDRPKAAKRFCDAVVNGLIHFTISEDGSYNKTNLKPALRHARDTKGDTESALVINTKDKSVLSFKIVSLKEDKEFTSNNTWGEYMHRKIKPDTGHFSRSIFDSHYVQYSPDGTQWLPLWEVTLQDMPLVCTAVATHTKRKHEEVQPQSPVPPALTTTVLPERVREMADKFPDCIEPRTPDCSRYTKNNSFVKYFIDCIVNGFFQVSSDRTQLVPTLRIARDFTGDTDTAIVVTQDEGSRKLHYSLIVIKTGQEFHGGHMAWLDAMMKPYSSSQRNTHSMFEQNYVIYCRRPGDWRPLWGLTESDFVAVYNPKRSRQFKKQKQ